MYIYIRMQHEKKEVEKRAKEGGGWVVKGFRK